MDAVVTGRAMVEIIDPHTHAISPDPCVTRPSWVMTQPKAAPYNADHPAVSALTQERGR